MAELHLTAPISGSITLPAAGGKSSTVVYVHNATTVDFQPQLGVDVKLHIAAGFCAEKTTSAPITLAARSATVGGIYRYGSRQPGGTTIRLEAELVAAGVDTPLTIQAG